MTEAGKKLQDTLIWLVYKDPLLAEFAEFVKAQPDPNIPTAGVRMSHNYIMLYYNEDWINSLDVDGLRFLMKHELYHVILAHVFCKLKNPMVDNVAADIEINQDPFAPPPPSLTEDLCTFGKFKLPASESREFYYQHLCKNSPCPMAAQGGCKDGKGTQGQQGQGQQGQGQGQQGQGQQGQGQGQQGQGQSQGQCPGVGKPGNCGGRTCPHHSFDDHSQWKDSTPDVEEVWRQKVEATIEAAKQKGTVSGRMAESILAKWKKHRDLLKLLKRVVGKEISSSVQDSTYWKKKNRRFPIYPGTRSMYGPKFVIAVDTSGSMSSPCLEACYGIIKWIRRQGFDGKLIQCDAEISDVTTLGKVKTEIKLKGRGGTSSIPVFKYIEEKKWNPDMLIFFTDLYTDFPVEKPPYKTVWVTENKDDRNVPFGKVVGM